MYKHIVEIASKHREWSRDKLMRLRSVYIEHRERSIINRQSDLSAYAQNEKDRIFMQLKKYLNAYWQ